MLRLAKALVLLFKLIGLALLSVEHLSNFHTRQILREEGVYIRGSVLNRTVCLTRELSENNREQNNERHEAKHHKRQSVIQEKHCGKYADDDKAILEQIYKQICKHH